MSDFKADFCWYFIVDLLMQHKLHYVNLIVEAREYNPIE